MADISDDQSPQEMQDGGRIIIKAEENMRTSQKTYRRTENDNFADVPRWITV